MISLTLLSLFVVSESLPLNELQRRSECIKLESAYQNFCPSQSEGTAYAAQGPAGKRGPSGQKGAQGIQGMRGLKGEVGEVNYDQLEAMVESKLRKSDMLQQRRDSGPQLHYYESTLTWESSKAFCEERGRALCTFDLICPMRNGGRQLIGFVKPGNHWAPILDATNDWVEIGDFWDKPCFRHNGRWNSPNWGATTVSAAYKGYVYCCETNVTYQYIGKSATYNSSMEFCQDQGRRLCDSSEVCKSNRPVLGLVKGDKWIAVRDQFNEWIQIGNSGGRTCKTHGHLHGLPTWGVREDGSLIDVVGYVYCCNM